MKKRCQVRLVILFSLGNLSSYKDQSEESGISKIKEKLSLKVKIPADKQSVEAEKKKNLEKDMKVKLKKLQNYYSYNRIYRN